MLETIYKNYHKLHYNEKVKVEAYTLLYLFVFIRYIYHSQEVIYGLSLLLPVTLNDIQGHFIFWKFFRTDVSLSKCSIDHLRR